MGIVTTAGLELFTSGQLEATITASQIRGFPAVVATPTRFRDFCSAIIDVGPKQLLDIQFSDGGREPPIAQDQLCLHAQRVASAAMTTLLAD
jgi:hypothetical protein